MPKHIITGEKYVENSSYQYVWRRAANLRSGDKVNRCGHDAEVESVRAEGDEVVLTVNHPIHGRREWKQKISDSLATLIR